MEFDAAELAAMLREFERKWSVLLEVFETHSSVESWGAVLIDHGAVNQRAASMDQGSPAVEQMIRVGAFGRTREEALASLLDVAQNLDQDDLSD